MSIILFTCLKFLEIHFCSLLYLLILKVNRFLRCFRVLNCELIFIGVVYENSEWLLGGAAGGARIIPERFVFAKHPRGVSRDCFIFKLKYSLHVLK